MKNSEWPNSNFTVVKTSRGLINKRRRVLLKDEVGKFKIVADYCVLLARVALSEKQIAIF